MIYNDSTRKNRLRCSRERALQNLASNIICQILQKKSKPRARPPCSPPAEAAGRRPAAERFRLGLRLTAEATQQINVFPSKPGSWPPGPRVPSEGSAPWPPPELLKCFLRALDGWLRKKIKEWKQITCEVRFRELLDRCGHRDRDIGHFRYENGSRPKR